MDHIGISDLLENEYHDYGDDLDQVKQDIDDDNVNEQTIKTLKRIYEELESKL